MRFWSAFRMSNKVALLAAVLGVAGAARAQAPSSCPSAPPVLPYPSTTTPIPSTDTTPSTPQTAPTPSDVASFPSATPGAGYGSDSVVGYIDSAIPQTQIRLRYDSADSANRPDRADFFYAKCGCFGSPDAKGPNNAETDVSYQELRLYAEFAVNERFSAFAEMPYRWVQFQNNPDGVGFSDLNFGAKYAMIAEECRFLTAQIRIQAPTGDSNKGLGTNNWWVNPAILYYQKIGDRVALEAEIQDYIAVERADDFAGNVLRAGVGVSYLALNGPSFRISPVLELVGWTVLEGKVLDPNNGTAENAAGETIVNAKAGVRFGFGQLSEPGMLSRSDFYIGYGRALTGDVWYKDIVRAEFRLRF